MAVEKRTIPRLATKSPAGKADYAVGWTLDTGDTISSAAVSSITSGIGLAIASTGASTVIVEASGGSRGGLYYFAVEIQTAGGRRFERQMVLPVDER